MHPLSCTFPENGCVAIFQEENNNLVFSCGAFNIKLNAVNIQPHYGLMKVNEVIKGLPIQMARVCQVEIMGISFSPQLQVFHTGAMDSHKVARVNQIIYYVAGKRMKVTEDKEVQDFHGYYTGSILKLMLRTFFIKVVKNRAFVIYRSS